jgi:hypothetical protein
MNIGQFKVAMWHNSVTLNGWLKKRKYLFGKIFQKIQMMPHVIFLGYHM